MNSFLSKLLLDSKQNKSNRSIDLYEIKMITGSTEVFECT